MFGINDRVGSVFRERCGYLCGLVLALVILAPIASDHYSRAVFTVIHLGVMTMAVAAVGRSPFSFWVALSLAIPAAGLNVMAHMMEHAEMLRGSWGLMAVFYLVALGFLLNYVFDLHVMSRDKLFGATCAFIMLGIFFTFVFACVQGQGSDAFMYLGEMKNLDIMDLLYFSFTIITSTGFGDIVPISRVAKSLVMLEQLVGILFTAVLIARLAGIYPSNKKQAADC